MKREKGSHEGASPPGPRHPLQDEKEQDRIDPVKEDIDEMVGTRAWPEELAVEHVREPRQRMPIRHGSRRESPSNSLPRQAVLNDDVVPDIMGIIIVDEIEVPYLPIDERRRNDKKKDDRQIVTDSGCGGSGHLTGPVSNGFSAG
jgi:hypothetical protein